MQPKLLYSDENPNFHRQIGCVAGIFHAFSRHRLHPSRRLTNLPHRPSSLGAPTHLEENYSEAASDADLIQADEVREASVAAAGEDTRRPAGVVAKLMGLESLPEIPPGISPEKMKSELRRGAPARLPVERAPWNRHVSVYSEVESKLKDLNLDQSNRDLRALKHILRSMQSKVNDEEDSKLPLGDLSGIKVNAKSTEEKSQREKNHRKAPLPGKSTGKGRQKRLSEVNAELGKKNLGEDFPAEIAAISVDQPSPVSVLDVSFPGDDRPFSPVSKKTDSFRGIEQEHNLPLRAFTAAIQKKFKSIENLLDKLSTLGCNGDVDHIAFLCEKPTPDYRYVSEVLLASGFLLTDLQLHRSSELPLNPDLFLVLEQTRSRDRFLGEPKHRNPNSAKIRRRLLFDALNEILVRKIDDSDSSRIASEEDHLPARKLLREICSEIETLESYLGIEEILREEVARQWRWWIGGGREIDIVVLEIERHIFKSLIDEVLAGGCVFSASGNPNRRRRRLFHPVK